MATKMVIEPVFEADFLDCSYGFRPKKSAKQAMDKIYDVADKGNALWVIDADIKDYFGSINHDKLMLLVEQRISDRRVLKLIRQWLKAGIMENGMVQQSKIGTPQGGVISPVLANLFLHYVFDDFMAKEFPSISWARYADDGVAHCVSLKQAKYLQRRLEERFASVGLELNLDKTKIVYCKDDDRTGNHEYTSFDFLGYTFRPRHAKNKYGKFFTNFLPAMGDKAKKAVRNEVRRWKLQLKPDKDLQDIANMFNSQIQGWINYYTHFYKSEIYEVLRYINRRLIYWVRRKYKNRNSRERAEYWLGRIAKRDRNLFVHWKFGILPAAG